MKARRIFVMAMAVGLLYACGGGAASEGSSLRFLVNYFPSQSALFPAGTIQVAPIAGEQTIGTKPIAKVELLLFGHERQELTAPNFEPKDNPQLRYVFTLPATFVTGLYPCGTGAFLSEVRVTDVSGFSVSKQFELCPGTPFETSASAP